MSRWNMWQTALKNSTQSEMGSYTSVTERPGLSVTREQLAMLYTRYHTAAKFCEGKDVLEVGCGPGIGLGYLAKKARKVVAGDVDEKLLKLAQEHYKGRERIELKAFDAHKLPFEDNSFDVVILFEVIYYLAQPEKFLEECRRVLRKDGVLLICTANKDCPEFVPSPFSIRYFSAPELFDLLRKQGFEAELFGAFPLQVRSPKQKLVSLTRRAVAALNLMPGSLRVRAILKRIFYGNLLVLPEELEEGMAEVYPLVPIPTDSKDLQHKVLYAIAHRQ